MDLSKIKKSPVLLKEENRRYAMDPGREMQGYIKMEQDGDKGLIVVMVDNLKFFPNGEYVYKLVFAGTKREKRQYHMVGNISLSAYGKGEASFRINPHDLDGKGMALHDFSAAIIAAMSSLNCREPLHPVLKGTFSVDKPSAQKPAAPTAKAKDYSGFYNRFVLDNCTRIESRQSVYTDIAPFGNDFTKAHWKKITDTSIFPMVSPGSEKPLSTYGHFLLGWNDTHYFAAVPGRFLSDEQPDGGASGFVYWQPLVSMEKESKDPSVPVSERRLKTYGYWIAAISRSDGHIEDITV